MAEIEDNEDIDVGGEGTNLLLATVSSLAVLGVTVLLVHKLEHKREFVPHIHAKYWGIAAVIIAFLPYSISTYVFSEFTLALVACLLPVYESVYAVCTPDEEDDTDWLRYWTIGGIFYVITEVVLKEFSTKADAYFLKFAICFVFWLYCPQTYGSLLIDDKITQTYCAPKLRPLLAQMNNIIQNVIQMCTNVSHLYVVWIFFMFLPEFLKRLVAIGVGTVYPFVCSVNAIATEEFEDDAYWLTYWSCYGILFIGMDFLEIWLGWIPGFYSLVIACEVYLMLPMFGGAEKIFRKVLVPLFKLEEYLMLRDAFFVKKRIWSELDADRSIAMRTAIAKLFAEEDDALGETKKNDLLESYAGILRSNKKSSGEPNEATNLV